ncbi:hypothetical protein LCGC14_2204870 [marine sediment metagenome]|uniref:Helix-turn-helix type 11 domain-containing protein n=1 Tax=marine sediment metagenome TaxID=412755 RepID=A0A0F9E2X3_9ZZZZ
MSNIEIKQIILEFLKRSYPKDFSVQEVANETKFHRNTVSVYLKVMVAEKKVLITRKIGKANLYSFLKL